MSDLNPLYDPATDNQAIAPEIQTMLNQPLSAGSWTSEEEGFLQQLTEKWENGTIKPYSPSSLLNEAVYSKLTLEGQALADKNALVLLTKIREIMDLMKITKEPTFQVKNLVEALFATKKRLEEHGDIFII